MTASHYTALGVEVRAFTNDDFGVTPRTFKPDFGDRTARLIRHDNCGMLLVEGDRPHYYFHNMDVETSRWSGFIRLGDGPLALQEAVEGIETAQTEPLEPYGVISEDPLTYGLKTMQGVPMEFTYNEQGCTWCEGPDGSVLDVTGEWFPYGLICHLGSEYDIPFMHLPVLLTGMYRGEPIEFLACIDRIFSPEGEEREIMSRATRYVSSYCSGVREDGRREWFVALSCHENGTGLGVYWLEGNDPIVATDVVNEGVWERLPYVDDGTVVCVENVWRFGGKEFHVTGSWGAKGFTPTPRYDRHGQSQVFGSWYEGQTPYRHRVWNTFSENMEAYADSMSANGFRVA